MQAEPTALADFLAMYEGSGDEEADDPNDDVDEKETSELGDPNDSMVEGMAPEMELPDLEVEEDSSDVLVGIGIADNEGAKLLEFLAPEAEEWQLLEVHPTGLHANPDYVNLREQIGYILDAKKGVRVQIHRPPEA